MSDTETKHIDISIDVNTENRSIWIRQKSTMDIVCRCYSYIVMINDNKIQIIERLSSSNNPGLHYKIESCKPFKKGLRRPFCVL